MPIYPKHTAPLVSLPMRITQMQRARLEAARDHDHIAIQEHVRRALDKYLDAVEKRRALEPPPAGPAELPDFIRDAPTIQQAREHSGVNPAGRRKVVYR